MEFRLENPIQSMTYVQRPNRCTVLHIMEFSDEIWDKAFFVNVGSP